jgi:hypothetical protein
VCGRAYRYSAQDVSLSSFSLISSKQFTCFLGCSGARSIALVTISISGVLFLVSRCFPLDIYSMPCGSARRTVAIRLRKAA